MLDIANADMYSVNNYLKNMDMQKKWEQKQRTGNYAADGVKSETESCRKQRDTFVKTAQTENTDQTTREKPKDKDEILETIKNKLSSGGMLTSSEMKYVQSKDEALYQQAVTAENERKIYEHELRLCRTKDDVQMYKMHHTVHAAERVKSILSDNSMSLGDKLNAVMGENKRMSAVNAAERDFVKSGEYSRLPSRAEKLKAERDLRRAKKEECRAAAEKRKEKKLEQEERAEKARRKRAEEKAKLQGKKVKKLDKKKRKFKAKKARYTTCQALNTTEAKKVRSANARADYEMSKGYALRAVISGDGGKSLDVTA
ncbi:MAG: hypothetical protein NC085_13555 [Muribaculaceae bacterium]|nr:hypothetical protein [Muribaculaceae bacterium]